VRRLRGGHALRRRAGRVELLRYWQYQPGLRPARLSARELEEELGRLVCAAVRRNLGAPERAIIFLSGGADSRGILGGALRAVGGDGGRLSTVTWGAERGGADSDVAVAERIAALAGTRHRFLLRRLD